MNRVVGSLHVILPLGLLAVLGLSAWGFQYCAVNAFEVGTDREYIPPLQKEKDSARPQCAKQR